MARSTKYATPICLVLTLLAAIGIVIGLVTGEPLYAVGFVAPSVAYEAYRTEGRSTRWASWTLVGLIVALAILVALDVEYDLRELLGSDVTYVGSDQIPLGDVKVVFAALMALLAALLWSRTRGVYTRWLAAIIFVSAAAVAYLTAPEALGDILDSVG